MKFPGTVLDMVLSWNVWGSGFGVRWFTFIPRRFTSHYWDARHCLLVVTWWQWFRRCFRVNSRVINRPEYSSWVQICQRANNGDLDAKLIRHFILETKIRIVSAEHNTIYDEIVRQTMADAQN